MTCFSRTLAACAAALVIAGTSAADSTISVDFNYAPNGSAEQNYNSFRKSARRACRAEYRRDRLSAGVRQHLVNACKAEMLDLVVDRVNRPDILALHQSDAAKPKWRLFARR